MPSMQQHSVIEQLIQSHIDFITQQFSNTELLKEEASHISRWLFQQKLANLFSIEQISAAVTHLFIGRSMSQALQSDIAQHIHLMLLHPLNQSTSLQDVIQTKHIHDLAHYIASKSTHRQKLIQDVVHHPAFARVFTDLIQHVLNDYFEQSMSAQRPSVSRFMKMGKSVFENMTDLNFTKTLTHYLEKNVAKLGDLSEKMLNQQLDDDAFYNLQCTLWEQIKALPLHILSQYIEVNDLTHTVHLAEQFPQHLSQTAYFKEQLSDHIVLWYTKYQDQPLSHLLHTMHVSEQALEHSILAVIQPFFQQMVQDEYIQNKLTTQLREFYYSDHTLNLLKQIT